MERTDHDGPLHRFAGPLRQIVYSRREGEDPNENWLARLQLAAAIKLAGDGLADQLADTDEEFWRHVRAGLGAVRDSYEEEPAERWA